MAFSPTDAAFEGFRLSKHEPRTILTWAAVSFAVTLAIALITLMLLGGSMARLEMDAAGADQTQQGLAVLRDTFPAYTVSLLLSLLVVSVFLNAIYRAVLRPKEEGLRHLKLGRDEVRTAWAVVVYGAIFVGLTFVVTLAIGLLAVVFQTMGPVAAGLGGLVLTFGGAFVFIYVWVRLSIALPLTLMRRRMSFRESWRLTQGKFWRLLGMNVLTFALTAVVMAVMFTVSFLLALAVSGGDIHAAVSAMKQEDRSIAGYLNPLMLSYLLVSAALSAVKNTLLYAPAAAACKAIVEDHEARTGETIGPAPMSAAEAIGVSV
jgi:hypothetical protein